MSGSETEFNVEVGNTFKYTPEEGNDPHPEIELPEVETHRVVSVGADEVNTKRVDVDTDTTFGWHSIPDDVDFVNEMVMVNE